MVPNEIGDAVNGLLHLLKDERDAAGRSEYGRLMSVAATEAEKLLAFIAYAQSQKPE